MTKSERTENLMPNGVPRYVRVYDLPTQGDRYTIVFTKKAITDGWRKRSFMYAASNSSPFHPQGFYQHGESPDFPIDRPTSSHLGKRIKFEDLPEDVQTAVIQDYKDLWSI